MEGMTLKSRAIAFAFCTGAVAFILALFAGAQAEMRDGDLSRAIILAIVCAVMSWASAERAIAGYAEAVDDSIVRLSQAAEGDLTSPTPPSVATVLPELATSLDGLLSRVRTNIGDVEVLALVDPVTQLPNRTHFRREAQRHLDAMDPTAMAGLFFIDLDKFKSVNDSFGHAQGDQVLLKVADRLRILADASDRTILVGRLAGDEFTVLACDVSSHDEAERIGDALLDTLSEPYEIAGHSLDIGASIGVSLRPEQGLALTDLMRAADVAMYRAKESGRAQCQFFTPSLAARLADDRRLETELRSAIDDGQFAFLYQPQLCLRSGTTRAAEALLRWRHPRLGVLAPSVFVPQAEQNGLIHEIGHWAVEHLTETLGRWERLGLTVRIAANISPRQIARPDFFSQVRRAMARNRASADLLELEITETIAMRCDETALLAISRLREQGATIAIDDFGTGYSNLARLKDLPIDRVKIDRSLTANLVTCAQSRIIVQSVIGLVHGLGFEVVAEGVENRSQRTVLEVAGCDAVQGFGIARPMDEDALMTWLHFQDGGRATA